MKREEIITGLKYIRSRAEISGDVDAWEAASEAIKVIELPTPWIYLKDEVPEVNKEILILYRFRGKLVITMAYKDDKAGYFFTNNYAWIPDELVVGWMNMPPMPEIKSL